MSAGPREDLQDEQPLLRVEEVRTHFRVAGGAYSGRSAVVRAVDGVSLRLARGRVLGIVGESGCGKSTLARTIVRLVPATSGRVWLDGQDVLGASGRDLRRLRRRMQMVFQDPAGSLNPRLDVETIVGEALAVHGLVRGRRERRERVVRVLERVGLSAGDLPRYPHEFSGGQKQRIGIARALVLDPELVICDEPVSALDVSIQSQILNLLAELQAERSLTLLIISHNLAVVQVVCDEVAVMYLGRVVETGPAAELFARPRHPYTQALLAAVPEPEPGAGRALPVLGGEPASPLRVPEGCAFHPRCEYADGRCRSERPELRVFAAGGGAGVLVACHHVERVAAAAGVR